MTNNSVLISGVGGFIASHVADFLIDMGYDVIGIDDLSGGFRSNIPKKVKFFKGSVCDDKLIKRLFKRFDFKYVFHLAAYAAENLSPHIKRFNYNNNLIGSVNLINESVNYKVRCFIFTSSLAVYGHGKTPMIETMHPEPQDSYGVAKYVVERELQMSAELFGLNYIIFRAYNVYGERQNIGDKYRNVIGIFINQIMQGKPLTVFGDGKQQRSFSYIKDVAPVIAKSIVYSKAYNQIFNIGADKPYMINEMIDILKEVWGLKAYDVKYLKERKEVKIAYCDCSKVKKVFDYNPAYSLRSGIDRMSVWAKKTGIRKSKEFKNIEIRQNLPEGW